MRLPVLQVFIDDSRRYGRALAALDPQKREQRWWRGLLEDLWDFGVKASGDARPDGRIKSPRALDLLAAGIDYPGASEELGELLQQVELLDYWPGGVRVKGVAELYGVAWDRKKQRSALGSKLAKARWKDAARITERMDTGDAETETETEREALVDPKKPGRPPKEPSTAEAFWNWAQAEALKKNPSRVPNDRHPKELNTLLKVSVARYGKLGLSRAWQAYLGNKYASDAGWPLELFISKIPELLNGTQKPAPETQHPKLVRL